MVTAWENDGLFATSNTNLVGNVGWWSDATHTKAKAPKHVRSVGGFPIEIIHPSSVNPDYRADRWVMRTTFPTTIRSIASRVLRKMGKVAGSSKPKGKVK
jgi:hypothetical protein